MVAQETMDTIESTIDAVSDGVETLERIPKAYLNGTTKAEAIIILGVTAGVSAVVASTITYQVVKNRLKLRYELLAEEEIAEAREYYASTAKPEATVGATESEDDSEPSRPATAEPASIDEVINKLAYRSYDETERPLRRSAEEVIAEEAEVSGARLEQIEGRVVESVTDIFNESGNGNFVWNQEQEDSKRRANPGRPYVISSEEWLEEQDFGKESLVYHDGGQTAVLADIQDQMVENGDQLIGESNLMRFGHGSDDKDTVYIRNEVLGTDFDITASGLSYARDVMGMDDEPDADDRHSARQPLRFRENE